MSWASMHNPPQQALVLLSASTRKEAKSRHWIEPNPACPLKKGRCGTHMTHDYKRHGTTTLFTALEVLQGEVVGQCYKPP